MDLGALENRLTAIEYGLAAMHHMLRTRLETHIAPPPIPNDDPLPPIVPETVRVETRSVAAIPPRASDPINPARRSGDRANLLVEAAFGNGDDLEHISGVGPMLRQLLNDTGVYYFWQIAEWSPEDVDWVDDKLQHFRGRIERDNWVDQARNLAAHHSSAKRPAAFIPGERLS
jgi:predicted flap endonuclease-1-like 5' DNA nuclease